MRMNSAHSLQSYFQGRCDQAYLQENCSLPLSKLGRFVCLFGFQLLQGTGGMVCGAAATGFHSKSSPGKICSFV